MGEWEQDPQRSSGGTGGGPLVAAGVMAGGALVAAGFGFIHLATSEGGIAHALGKDDHSVSAEVDPTRPDHGGPDRTVTLPDADGNGVPDQYEDQGGKNDHGERGDRPDGDSPIGRGDREHEQGDRSGRGDRENPGREDDPERSTTKVYRIQWGDTLSEISGETGIPIEILMEKNHIKNPDLIYAGSSLLIPPRD